MAPWSLSDLLCIGTLMLISPVWSAFFIVKLVELVRSAER